jgi:hypothetical protein
VENKKILPWARFGFESVLIIVSILAALGIDSWLSARQLAAEELLLLEQLKTEFEWNSQHLNERRGQQEEIIHAARKLLDVTGPKSANSGYDLDSIKEDMFSLVIRWTYDPRMGVLNGIIQSGKLGVISSTELQSTLASWPALVRDLAEDEAAVVEYTGWFAREFLSTHIAMRNFADPTGVGRSQFPGEIEQLLSNRGFENGVLGKLNLTWASLNDYDKVRDYLDDVLSQIDRQLEITRP